MTTAVAEVAHLIGGAWRQGAGDVHAMWDIRAGRLLDTFVSAGDDDVDDAVAAAREAAPAWAALGVEARARRVCAAADAAESAAETLAESAAAELGIERDVALLDLRVGTRSARAAADAAREAFAAEDLFPIGAVGLVTPPAVPFSVPLWKLATLVASGNTVVWKPSLSAVGAAVEIARIFDTLGDGVVNVVLGDDPASRRLVGSALDGISVVGSRASAGWFRTLAGGADRPLDADVGGIGVAVVLADADVAAAASAIVDDAIAVGGQRSGTTKVAVVERPAAEAFAAAVGARLDTIDALPLLEAAVAHRLRQVAGTATAAGRRVWTRDRSVGLDERFVEPVAFEAPDGVRGFVPLAAPVLGIAIAEDDAGIVALSHGSLVATVFGGRARSHATALRLDALVVRTEIATYPVVYARSTLPRVATGPFDVAPRFVRAQRGGIKA